MPKKLLFLSTPSVRRATWPGDTANSIKLFLSTPSARRATTRPATAPGRPCDFYPRPPRGGRRRNSPPADISSSNFYPRPPRGGRRRTASYPAGGNRISIHALREEGDWFWFCCEWRRRHFYPHPLRGGRRCRLRGILWTNLNFYPRPPRGGRRDLGGTAGGVGKEKARHPLSR